jgi:YbgC/YbaW family acyl-CoA thioester hydrolase
VVHRTSIAVRFGELDPYNHVNHAAYVTYFEVARTEALAEVGLALQDLQADGYQIVVTDLRVRYRRAAGAGDELTVETVIDEIRGASSVWRQRILCCGEVVATAELRGGVTDATGRPTRIPPEMRTRLEALTERD